MCRRPGVVNWPIFQALQLNWDEAKDDGVFNNATGELCCASSPDSISPVASSSDITRLTVSHIHTTSQPIPGAFYKLNSQFILSSLFLYRSFPLMQWLLSVCTTLCVYTCPESWMWESKRWRQVSQLDARSGNQRFSSSGSFYAGGTLKCGSSQMSYF